MERRPASPSHFVPRENSLSPRFDMSALGAASFGTSSCPIGENEARVRSWAGLRTGCKARLVEGRGAWTGCAARFKMGLVGRVRVAFLLVWSEVR